MRFDDYRRYDGLGLAELIRAREVSASEVLEAALARAEAVGPQLNAIVIPMDEIARERAATSPKGPFGGVPFALKDVGQEYAGALCTYGSRGLKECGYRPAGHAEITARWLKAGLVMLGRTNTPEFAMQVVSEPELWGPAHNPWDLARTPAGSSGGSAAAVAAGIVPCAGGNDLAGSIRIPSAVCGLFGFKPGRGRTPWGPERGEMLLGAALNHALTRSVRDSAALLDATTGPELASSFVVAPPERPYLDEVTRDGPRLRIGFSTRSPLGSAVDREAVLAVDNAAQRLASLGHFVEPAEPKIDAEALIADFLRLPMIAACMAEREIVRLVGRAGLKLERDTRLLARLGHALRADELALSVDRWNTYVLAMNSFHQTWDVFMTPTTAELSPLIGAKATPKALSVLGEVAGRLGLARAILESGFAERLIREKLGWAPFCLLANLTGAPAMSVPLHWTRTGLPMGVHFMAKAGGEGTLFRLAGELERAQPWFERTAPL